MQSPIIHTEQRHTGEHILSEANGWRSREEIVINAGAGKLVPGTVLAKISAANSADVTPGSNTGNGTFSAATASNDAITGTYTVTITEAAADGGTFEVTDPLNNTLGTGTVGTEFSQGGLTFTIADGATDFEVGDSWTIAVAAGQGEWVAYDDDGTDDGRRIAAGVLYAGVDATTKDAKAVAHVRDCELHGDCLTGLDDAAVADLEAIGIILRWS